MATEYHPDRVPNAETATAAEEKFVWLLTKDKAPCFASLGFTTANWTDLKANLLLQLPTLPVESRRPNGGGGTNCVVPMTLTGPNGSGYFKTVWDATPSGTVHLVTVVPVKPARLSAEK